MNGYSKHLETYLVLGIVCLCVVLGFDSAASWHDTSEFASVGRLLTTSHSPGHPIYTVLSSGWVNLIPVGTVAFRAACFSGFCCVLSLMILLRCLTELGVEQRGGLYWLAGGVLSPPVMIQAVRPEVYGLALFLTSCAVLLWLRWWRSGDDRGCICLAFLIGLAGANHSYIALIPLPLILVSFIYRRLSIRVFIMSGLGGMMGLLTYVLLPLRSGRVEIGWGTAETPGAFWRMVSAQEWTKSLVPEGVTPINQLIETCVAFIEWLGVVGFCIWFVALAVSFTLAVLNRNVAALVLFGLSVCFLFFRGLIEVDIHNPDLMGYLAPGFMIGLLAQACAFSDLRMPMARIAYGVGIVFFASMLLALKVPNGEYTADRYARQMLQEVPADGVLVTSNYSSWFWTWYLRGIEGQRPDVAVLFRGRLGERWQTDRLELSFPGFSKRVQTYPHAFAVADTAWEPGVLLPETIGDIQLRPKGLTFSVDMRLEAGVVREAFNRVFGSASLHDRRQEAFVRYESLRLMKYMNLTQNYLQIHRPELDRLGGGDPLIKSLLRDTDPIRRGHEN